MSDLAAFLTARLDEDEPIARAFEGWDLPSHAVNPGRLIREVMAKRAILTEYVAARKLQELTGTKKDGYRDWILSQIGAAYSDHPDYRQEWKP